MIKYEIHKFLEIVESEMLDFPDINKEDVIYWKNSFWGLLKNNKISKKNIRRDKDKTYFCIEDEMEIFSIIDDFLISKDENDLKTYWNSFK